MVLKTVVSTAELTTSARVVSLARTCTAEAATAVAASMSVKVLSVIVAAIWSPTTIDRAVEPSCARVTVSMSATTAVTRTISALLGAATASAGHTVALNGGIGNRADAWPVVTKSVVPLSAGAGAISTTESAKLRWSSNDMA